MGGYNNTSIPTRRNHHRPTRVTLPKAPANLSTCPSLCDYGLGADGASAAANTEGVLDVAEVADVPVQVSRCAVGTVEGVEVGACGEAAVAEVARGAAE